jgi:hypothetical protein
MVLAASAILLVCGLLAAFAGIASIDDARPRADRVFSWSMAVLAISLGVWAGVGVGAVIGDNGGPCKAEGRS